MIDAVNLKNTDVDPYSSTIDLIDYMHTALNIFKDIPYFVQN